MALPFGHDIPRLSWLNGKTYKQHGDSHKNRSRHAPEHAAANLDHLKFITDQLAEIGTKPEQPMLTDGN